MVRITSIMALVSSLLPMILASRPPTKVMPHNSIMARIPPAFNLERRQSNAECDIGWYMCSDQKTCCPNNWTCEATTCVDVPPNETTVVVVITPSSTETGSSGSKSGNQSSSTPIIAGVVAGGALFLIIMCLVIFVCVKKRKERLEIIRSQSRTLQPEVRAEPPMRPPQLPPPVGGDMAVMERIGTGFAQEGRNQIGLPLQKPLDPNQPYPYPQQPMLYQQPHPHYSQSQPIQPAPTTPQYELHGQAQQFVQGQEQQPQYELQGQQEQPKPEDHQLNCQELETTGTNYAAHPVALRVGSPVDPFRADAMGLIPVAQDSADGRTTPSTVGSHPTSRYHDPNISSRAASPPSAYVQQYQQRASIHRRAVSPHVEAYPSQQHQGQQLEQVQERQDYDRYGYGRQYSSSQSPPPAEHTATPPPQYPGSAQPQQEQQQQGLQDGAAGPMSASWGQH